MPVEGHFVMAAGGTGGHVIPALAVARELRERGREVIFWGTRAGVEARMAPAEGFPIEWIEIGGLKNLGVARQMQSLLQLGRATWRLRRAIKRWRPAAVFSMGGYVAGPSVIAAILSNVPVVAMEPNAVPGLTNRAVGRWIVRALTAFEETARYFPGRAERTGVPVRAEFFAIAPKPPSDVFHVLVTGGSQGSRTLNRAARDSWPLFRREGLPVRMTLQCGRNDSAEDLSSFLKNAGMEGDVMEFIDGMPAAFAAADLIFCRSGAGCCAELAAAGKPAVLVPFPFAADQHQLRNAEAMERAGAARVVRDSEMTGRKLFEMVASFAADQGGLRRMGEAARSLGMPGAAKRAADALEEAAR
ncbi:MAG: undecaprenyldiphospho-muramoylpentapeptide beta-N-acetylglucosaminyltransferase [Bryobacterales bacterium]|nr:undecaprenyldiphospho-muramoylpentapeptide beta-N-acetylglucosaminyltransferase [Bryobacterales bacterium]